ncbi:MAG: DUF1080 domain-containing protein [Puia sp.]|nr:DUF1080 domain-containing protein [Puia sp.]
MTLTDRLSIRRSLFLSTALLVSGAQCVFAQEKNPAELSEYYSPVPEIVTPGKTSSDAPSDAIVLFNGKDASSWAAQDGGPVKWQVGDNAITVVGGTGTIHTKQGFGDCQLHIEFREPSEVKGEGQGRGNSGIFLMGRYELQVLDCYNNKTYVNGQTGSIYKQLVPLANACRPPGEWQTYDIIFTAPLFNEDGTVKAQARITVIHNGVLIQNNASIWGSTEYIGTPKYEKHGPKEALVLQDHGDRVSYRNIWIRPL